MADISQYLMPVDTNIEIASVILSAENKDKIQIFLNEIENREKLLR